MAQKCCGPVYEAKHHLPNPVSDCTSASLACNPFLIGYSMTIYGPPVWYWTFETGDAPIVDDVHISKPKNPYTVSMGFLWENPPPSTNEHPQEHIQPEGCMYSFACPGAGPNSWQNRQIRAGQDFVAWCGFIHGKCVYYTYYIYMVNYLHSIMTNNNNT